MIDDVLVALFSGGDIFSIPFSVDDLRAVAFSIDLDFKIVRGLLGLSHRHDFHRLTGRQHSVHACGADTDSLLSPAHPEPMKLRSVEKLSENQGNLLPNDSGA